MAKTTRHGGASNALVTYPQSVVSGQDSPVPEPEAAESEYAEFTVEELRAELRGRELPTSGAKAELVARLEADDATDDPTDDESGEPDGDG
jgi:hypothetical protein